MTLDMGQATTLVVTVTGVFSAVTAYALGKRGQRNDEKQMSAKTKLEERVNAFDELESINDRLEKENARLRDLVTEAEATGNARLAAQGRRCRDQLEQAMRTISTLQTVTLNEVARTAAGDVIEEAVRHLSADHADEAEAE